MTHQHGRHMSTRIEHQSRAHGNILKVLIEKHEEKVVDLLKNGIMRAIFQQCLVLNDTVVELELLGVQVDCDPKGWWQRL